MFRSDFIWVSFFEDFNSQTTTATRTFQIDGTPTGIGYLLIQQFDVEIASHRILINDKDLQGFDLSAVRPGDPDRIWLTWMDGIRPGLLCQGENRITIRRSATEDEFFRIANVAVHWRERD